MNQTLPRHLGIIMDGNRRWARGKGLAALFGHEYVANQVIEPLIKECINQGIEYVTLWAFSTENWRRDAQEVDGLMQLFRLAFQKNSVELHKLGVRLQMVGDISAFPSDIQASIREWVSLTAQNTQITVVFALNYGGRDELVRAFRHIAQSGEEITEARVSESLDTGRHGIPDPDFIIRPGGEVRLSGFLPWQAVYAELYFTDTLMPDFDVKALREALDEYARRQRRFGV